MCIMTLVFDKLWNKVIQRPRYIGGEQLSISRNWENLNFGLNMKVIFLKQFFSDALNSYDDCFENFSINAE